MSKVLIIGAAPVWTQAEYAAIKEVAMAAGAHAAVVTKS